MRIARTSMRKLLILCSSLTLLCCLSTCLKAQQIKWDPRSWLSHNPTVIPSCCHTAAPFRPYFALALHPADQMENVKWLLNLHRIEKQTLRLCLLSDFKKKRHQILRKNCIVCLCKVKQNLFHSGVVIWLKNLLQAVVLRAWPCSNMANYDPFGR